MNLKNITSSDITELVSSGKLILSELSREDLEAIHDIEVSELYKDKNHSMNLIKMCAEELSRYCMEDPHFAASAEKKITLDEISSIYEKRRSTESKEADARNHNRNRLDEKSYSIHTPRSVNRRWLAPLAALMSLLMFTTVIAYALVPGFRGMTNEAFQQLKEKINYEYGNSDIIKTETSRTYTSFDEFVENEDVENILLPYGIVDKITVNTIKFSDYGTYNDILLVFNYENSDQKINIKTSYTPEYDFSDKTVLIGNFDVYWYEYDGVCQGDFICDGDFYTISCSSYKILEAIITNLEIK